MGTEIHFSGGDSVEVKEELGEVVDRLNAGLQTDEDMADNLVRLELASGQPVIFPATAVRYIVAPH